MRTLPAGLRRAVFESSPRWLRLGLQAPVRLVGPLAHLYLNAVAAAGAHLLLHAAHLHIATASRGEVVPVTSMHKLTAGDGYAYLTRHVAAGDAGLDAGTSLTAYYEQTGTPLAVGPVRSRRVW